MKQDKNIIYGLTALCAVLLIVVAVLLVKILTPQVPQELDAGRQDSAAQEPGRGEPESAPQELDAGRQDSAAQEPGQDGRDSAVQPSAGIEADSTQDVGPEAAKSAALTHAGLSESQVTGMKVKQDWEDGRLEYEIEFWSDDMEYDYTIDGITGSILGCKQEVRDLGRGKQDVGQETQDVGPEAAKSAALTHAGLSESQVTGMKVEQDWEDGRLEYEIEFKYDGMEYDYTIAGATGFILSCEKEIDD